MAPSASFALTTILQGWNWNGRRTFISSDVEYSSNLLVVSEYCKKSNCNLKTVPTKNGWIDYEKMIKNIDLSTAAVVISSVQFSTGQIAPIKDLQAKCRECGARLIIDATQSLGVLPMQLDGDKFDAVYSSAHKWLCSLPLGVFVLSESFGKSLRPLVHSALSYDDALGKGGVEFTAKKNMERFLWGTPDIVAISALSGACEALASVGLSNIFNSALDSAVKFQQSINSIPRFGVDSQYVKFPIVRVIFDGDILKAHQFLLKKNILCSTREGGLRFSFHGYSNERDLDSAIDCIKEISCSNF